MDQLTKITINIPNTVPAFQQSFLDFFSELGQATDTGIKFYMSNENYFPETVVTFSSETKVPTCEFLIGKSRRIIELTNKTGYVKSSVHTYSYIEIEEFMLRMANIKPTNLDHAGIDLPWFDGIHPEILNLRQVLKKKSLYYLFPSGEPWDFILPGTSEEISNPKDSNLNIVRRPKFEIVSLDKASTPIIQFEFHVKAPYQKLLDMFPEGIGVADIKCIWVYLKNEFGVDICMVVNEDLGNDWCDYFVNNRLI